MERTPYNVWVNKRSVRLKKNGTHNALALTGQTHTNRAAAASGWAPLRHPAYRALWIANLASNLGSWMQDMGAAWLMTTLTPSPVLIALVQAATSLPVFFLAIPAGALADIVARRRVLLLSNMWALGSVVALTYFTLAERISPAILLALTFSVGIGWTLEGPALQAVVTELVSYEEVPAAVALDIAGYNLARAVGPAAGGLIPYSLPSMVLIVPIWARPQQLSHKNPTLPVSY